MEKSLDTFSQFLRLNVPQMDLVICRGRKTVQLGAEEGMW